MSDRADWSQLRERRMAEPGAAEAYDASRLAFELGRAVRELRERRSWSQLELAEAASMTHSAAAALKPAGRCPLFRCWSVLLAHATFTLDRFSESARR